MEKTDIGYMLLLGILVVIVVLVLLYLVWRYKKELKQQNILLEEKDEKIKWLREIGGKNDHKYAIKTQASEKKILELTHTIQILESKEKEGTKNQVVAKIEAEQARREKLLERAGINVEQR